jgi:hypothetical protein
MGTFLSSYKGTFSKSRDRMFFGVASQTDLCEITG